MPCFGWDGLHGTGRSREALPGCTGPAVLLPYASVVPLYMVIAHLPVVHSLGLKGCCSM